MQANALLLSVRPKYADMIFSGAKSIELRRVAPKAQRGDRVFVYVSSPTKELHGTFTVRNIVKMPLEELWEYVKLDAGVSQEEFREYFSGALFGFGIHLESPNRFHTPVSLEEIQERWKGFRPPQSFRYLNSTELAYLAC